MTTASGPTSAFMPIAAIGTIATMGTERPITDGGNHPETSEQFDEPTSMHLLKGTKERFDSIRRQLEAERDRDLNNSAVLETLMDAYETTTDTEPDAETEPTEEANDAE